MPILNSSVFNELNFILNASKLFIQIKKENRSHISLGRLFSFLIIIKFNNKNISNFLQIQNILLKFEKSNKE